jgi:hypothetical protein
VSVFFSSSWASPAQPFSSLSPTGLMSILHCLYFLDSPNQEDQIPVFISPRNKVAPGHWVTTLYASTACYYYRFTFIQKTLRDCIGVFLCLLRVLWCTSVNTPLNSVMEDMDDKRRTGPHIIMLEFAVSEPSSEQDSVPVPSDFLSLNFFK